MWLYANITGIYLVKIHHVLVSQCIYGLPETGSFHADLSNPLRDIAL
jgi:hypothetical protein